MCVVLMREGESMCVYSIAKRRGGGGGGGGGG